MGLVARIRNKIDNKRYVVSTAKNPYGVFEIAVFEANFLYFAKNLFKPILVLNSNNEGEAQILHQKISHLIETKDPQGLKQDYIKIVKLKFGQFILGELNKRPNEENDFT